MTPTKRRPERIPLRVAKGALIPADSLAASRLRAKGYSLNDVVFAEIKKPRNPKFHRLAHRIGSLVAENIDVFTGMSAHDVLKRLQWEANIGCEEVVVQEANGDIRLIRWPQSLSFESMDEGEFREVVTAFCRHIAETYWPDLDPEQIEDMADSMVDAA